MILGRLDSEKKQLPLLLRSLGEAHRSPLLATLRCERTPLGVLTLGFDELSRTVGWFLTNRNG